MKLNYAKLEFDSSGRPEVPELLLQTLSGASIGVLSGVTDLKFNIKFSEVSEMSFTIPAHSDGKPTPYYNDISGYKVLYTKHYGIYQIMQPVVTGDGISEVKEVKGYSIEKTMEQKRFFLEEGTYNFWNPADPDDTILGRALEIAGGWSVGEVSNTLIGRYRTFDSYDDYLLSFLYKDAPEKFRCVFVFDPYEKKINVYDADEERSTLPVYLDFDNLVQKVEVEEVSDELVTAMRPYGADDLDIRAVNPTGTNWIYDLSYFISNGDIPAQLAEKWKVWQHSILNRQETYKGLVCLQASATSRLLTAQAKLVDLQGELDDLTNQQSIIIQNIANETPDGKETQQEKLDEINLQIKEKKTEITKQNDLIASIQNELSEDNENSYTAQIKAINNELALDKFFTADETETLRHYFIEQDMTEDTFVATEIDASTSGSTTDVVDGTVSVSGAKITKIDLTEKYAKNMYAITGGTFALPASKNGNALAGDIIRATIEHKNDGGYVMTIYAGAMRAGESSAPSGMVTVSGTLSDLSSNITTVTDDGITTYEGTQLRFRISKSSMYMTANVSNYQKYAVQMELFDYAVDMLSDLATPTYEFKVDSGNFIFAQEFAPFRNKLELGSGVYLRLNDNEVITPLAIEMQLDFEKREEFSLVFSNRFKRHDHVNTLKNMIENSYSSSRKFDASRYLYNQTAGQASMVSEFMNSALEAAVNHIIGAKNQSVVINGAGVQIGGDDDCKMRIVNNMIAITDDDWSTAKLAIGQFATGSGGTYFGVNADVIGGKLVVSNNLIIENTNDQGVMQFKVDASGAWLNNSTFLLQKDGGGKILLDPKYGITAGNGNLFHVDGTTVVPSFIDDSGKMILDKFGIPENANFHLDLQNGNAYFRGTVSATAGEIGGFSIADSYLHSGDNTTYVALNGGTNNNSAYAIWAGAESPGSAPFWVKRNGDIYAKNGTFGGTLDAANVSGSLTAADNDSWLIGCGIDINNGVFKVEPNGDVTMNGNLVLANGVIKWGNLDGSVTGAIDNAQDLADYAETLAKQIANGTYSNGTFISNREIFSPTIYANEFSVFPESKTNLAGGFSLYSYYDNILKKFVYIYYNEATSPVVRFSSPGGAYAHWEFPVTHFYGNLYFSGDLDFYGSTMNFAGATVENLNIPAKFG